MSLQHTTTQDNTTKDKTTQDNSTGTGMRLFLTRVELFSNTHNALLQTQYLLTNQPRRSFSNGDGLPMLCAPAPRGVPGPGDGVPGGVQGCQEEGSGPDWLLEEVAVQQCSGGGSVAGVELETGCG